MVHVYGAQLPNLGQGFSFFSVMSYSKLDCFFVNAQVLYLPKSRRCTFSVIPLLPTTPRSIKGVSDDRNL